MSNDILEKSQGEGSRGGKIIGHTKSGKPIYANASHPSHKDFSVHDHKEAAQIHRERMAQHNKAGEGHLYHSSMAYRDQHEAMAKQKIEQEEKISEQVKLISKLSIPSDMSAVIYSQNNGKDYGFSFHPIGVKTGDEITLADGRTKVTVDKVVNSKDSIQKALSTLEIGYLSGEVDEQTIISARISAEDLEKGRKANIGEIRDWKGGKYRRTAEGWESVKEGGKLKHYDEWYDLSKEEQEKVRTEARNWWSSLSMNEQEKYRKEHPFFGEMGKYYLNSHKSGIEQLYMYHKDKVKSESKTGKATDQPKMSEKVQDKLFGGEKLPELKWEKHPYGGEYTSYKMGTISRYTENNKTNYSVKLGAGLKSAENLNASSLKDAIDKIDSYTQKRNA